MKFKRAVSCAVVVASFGFGAAEAANLKNADQPAEFPPASYKGSQYVDSRGCVYIRAGIDGNVTWVPRVTRGRDHICSAQPTFAQAPKAEAPVASARAKEPVQIIIPQAPAETAPAPRSTRETTKVASVAPSATPEPRKVPKFTLSSLFASKPRPEVVKPAEVVSLPAPRVAAPVPIVAQSPCQGASPISQKYLGTGDGVRCGPQAESPITYVTGTGQTLRRSASVAPADDMVPIRPPVSFDYSTGPATSASTRVVPRHVYEQQQRSQINRPIPDGYREVWEDDRLNPKRAHQTLAGKAQMDLIWSQTVPRVLLDSRTGQDVSHMHPNLQYPYTDLVTQIRAQMPGTQAVAAPIVSSKSRPLEKSAPKAQAQGRSYVQVASFANPDNAQQTARRLAASGLPMRIWTGKRNGKSLQMVVVGPFADAQAASAALRQVQRAGFSDAFLRR